MSIETDVMRALTDQTRSLGKIEGEMMEIRKLNERVAKLEQWQSWLKGGWAVLAGGLAYVMQKRPW